MRVLIVEDEASIMDRLVRLTRKVLGEELKLLKQETTLAAAQARLQSEPLDVLMLDLNLNGEDGFQILRNLVSHSFHTIVVSAYPQRAIEAYDLGVIDFVTKPFSEERLSQSFNRVLGLQANRGHFAKFLAIRQQGKIELIPLNDIEYIQADGPCSRVATTTGKTLTHDKMLKNLSAILPDSFERVHKSYLVNMRKVIRLERGNDHKNFVAFASDSRIPVSRSKIKRIAAAIEGREYTLDEK